MGRGRGELAGGLRHQAAGLALGRGGMGFARRWAALNTKHTKESILVGGEGQAANNRKHPMQIAVARQTLFTPIWTYV